MNSISVPSPSAFTVVDDKTDELVDDDVSALATSSVLCNIGNRKHGHAKMITSTPSKTLWLILGSNATTLWMNLTRS